MRSKARKGVLCGECQVIRADARKPTLNWLIGCDSWNKIQIIFCMNFRVQSIWDSHKISFQIKIPPPTATQTPTEPPILSPRVNLNKQFRKSQKKKGILNFTSWMNILTCTLPLSLACLIIKLELIELQLLS